MKNPILENIQKEFKQFEDKKKALVTQLRQEFPGILKPLFDQSEVIKSIGWAQYTPYFMDGDECVFGTNFDYALEVNGTSIEDWDEEEAGAKDIFNKTYYKSENGSYTKVKNPDYNEKEGNLVEDFKKILNGIPDEFYKDLFGDHCKVTVFNDGKINIDDYEHD